MRWVILALVSVWTVLTVVGYTVVLPSEAEDIDIIASYFEVDGEADPELQAFLDGFRAFARDRTGDDVPSDLDAILTLPATQRDRLIAVGRNGRLELFALKITGHQLGQCSLVVDDKCAVTR